MKGRYREKLRPVSSRRNHFSASPRYGDEGGRVVGLRPGWKDEKTWVDGNERTRENERKRKAWRQNGEAGSTLEASCSPPEGGNAFPPYTVHLVSPGIAHSFGLVHDNEIFKQLRPSAPTWLLHWRDSQKYFFYTMDLSSLSRAIHVIHERYCSGASLQQILFSFLEEDGQRRVM